MSHDLICPYKSSAIVTFSHQMLRAKRRSVRLAATHVDGGKRGGGSEGGGEEGGVTMEGGGGTTGGGVRWEEKDGRRGLGGGERRRVRSLLVANAFDTCPVAANRETPAKREAAEASSKGNAVIRFELISRKTFSSLPMPTPLLTRTHMYRDHYWYLSTSSGVRVHGSLSLERLLLGRSLCTARRFLW